jgi:type I restriction-modification system DNA methylase subunit
MTNPERAKLQKIISTYLKELHEIYMGGNFREESFYPALKEVLERRDRDSIPSESFYEVFRRTLIGSLTEERFVDLYAQTITYGLFAAKIMAGNIHFYDTFLGEYNPEERAKLGVYYTPPEVVDYIVKSIHKLLKDKFGKDKGLAEEDLKLLDPAAGTLTFIIRAPGRALLELQDKHLGGMIPLNIKNLCELGKELVELHLLKHPSLSKREIGFPVSGSNTVEKVLYDKETRRVYFNKGQ